MRPPDMYDCAWLISARDGVPDHTATLRSWLIQGPWHPFWSFWQVSAIHLRDIPGVKPANKDFPNAEHELMIVSLKSPPHSELVPDPDDLQTLRPLLPIDFRKQFAGLTDAMMVDICDTLMRAIARDRQSPDSDNRGYWDSVTGPEMVEHYRSGFHTPEEIQP